MEIFIIQLLLLFVASSFRWCHGNMRHNTYLKSVRDGDCSIEPMTSEIRELIGKALNNRKRMIKFNIDMSGDSGKFFETVPENTLYRPHEWILTTDETARRLLMLLEDFVPRSLFTLSFDVGYIQLTFQQIPQNCVGNTKLNTVQSMIQRNILKNFSNENFDVGENLAVCNRQIAHQQIKYNCCWMSYDNLVGGELKCNELNEDDSVKTFLLVQNLIIYIAALYCPRLLPSFLFKKRKIKFCIDFKKWKNKVTATNKRTNDEHTPLVKRGVFNKVEDGKTLEVNLEKVTIETDLDNLIEEGSSYYAATKYFWDTFVMLKTFSNITFGEKDKTLIENIYFKYFMYIYRSFIIMVISLSPLVLVYTFYFMYGKLVVEYDKQISKVHGISIATPSDIELSFILGPIPDLCMYIAVFVTFCFLQIWSESVQDYFYETICKSTKYMHMSFDQFENEIRTKIKNYKIKDKYFKPIYIIFITTSFFPLAHLILLQILLHVILLKNKDDIEQGMPRSKNTASQNEQSNRESNRNQWSNKTVAEIIILTVWQACTLFLLIWYVIICTAYVVNFSVYSLLGCLLHFEDMFRYIFFISLIIVYGYNCFNEVTEKYRKFLNIVKESIQKLISKNKTSIIQNEEQTLAYFIPMTRQDFTLETQELNGKTVARIKKHGLLLFIEYIDNKVVLFIPVSFFNEMISFTHAACPGKPHNLYMRALKRFCLVVLFLLYTYMVIFAMGEAHDIPSGVQTLVGLGAGFLPFAFNHFIFTARKYSLKDIKYDLLWEELFNATLEKFEDNRTLKNVEIDYKQYRNVNS